MAARDVGAVPERVMAPTAPETQVDLWRGRLGPALELAERYQSLGMTRAALRLVKGADTLARNSGDRSLGTRALGRAL